MKKHVLTKTKLVRGFQCPKQLFLMIHKPEEAVEEYDDQSREFGISVGELAREEYKGGVLVESVDISKSLIETESLLKTKKTIFEAAFKFQNFFCRVDILEKTKDGTYEITEVKASTHTIGEKVKEHQVLDTIVQYVILDSLGYKVSKVNILLLNKKFEIGGKEDLFVKVDITEKANEKKQFIKAEMEKLAIILDSDKEPAVSIGTHCNNPINCPFKDYCLKQKKVPEISVLSLQNFPKKYDYLEKGIIGIEELKPSELTEGQQEQVRKLKLKRPEIDKDEVRRVLSSWKSPLFFLDFEAFSSPIPMFPKSNPFSKIPYQFSCSSIRNGKLTTEPSFLAESLDKDPRIAIAKKLVEVLGDKGSIVVYNQGFEKSIIRDLAEVSPQLKAKLENINSRVVDLFELIKKHVYYPEFKNRFSIKVVAPAMLGKESSYKELSVSNGIESVGTYLKAIKENNIEDVKQDLIDYCDKDVLEMVKLYLFLLKKVK